MTALRRTTARAGAHAVVLVAAAGGTRALAVASDAARIATAAASIAASLVALASCGGGAGNPLDNPPNVANAQTTSGQHLSFAYFQRCIQPILTAQLQAPQGGATNTCAGSGCHDNTTGTGGAFRVVANAQPIDLADPANTPDVIRASAMYKNFYSAQGEVVIGSTTGSRLLAKPLLLNVLHGGGLIFSSESDPNARLIAYWIGHPAPAGQDEFSAATYALFTPPDPKTGSCNTQ